MPPPPLDRQTLIRMLRAVPDDRAQRATWARQAADMLEADEVVQRSNATRISAGRALPGNADAERAHAALASAQNEVERLSARVASLQKQVTEEQDKTFAMSRALNAERREAMELNETLETERSHVSDLQRDLRIADLEMRSAQETARIVGADATARVEAANQRATAKIEQMERRYRLNQRTAAVMREVKAVHGKTHPVVVLVSEYYSVTIANILGKNRATSVIAARTTIMFVLRSRGYSLPNIGKILDRDHSTVMTGLETFARLAGERPEIGEVAHSLVKQMQERQLCLPVTDGRSVSEVVQ